MKSYDKAAWHIDAGEKEKDVVARFKVIFEFLNEKNMLNANGKETLEYAMDSSVSLNSTMVNGNGKAFLNSYYDDIVGATTKSILQRLNAAYKEYMEE